MNQYVALLRGINVGGKNLIKMAELTVCFAAAGFHDVITYIQSGNVLFTSAESRRAKLTPAIEEMLAATFNYRASVLLRSRKELQEIVAHAPDGFGERPSLCRYDVIFLKEPLTAMATIKSVPAREGVDRVYAGDGVLYCSRLISKAAQSRLSRLVSLDTYQSMTIRNWNTTTKLLRMMEED